MKLISLSKFLALIGLAMTATNSAAASIDEDKKIVAALDTRYQAAVEKNDAETMARIHHENMVLVLSDGTVQTGDFLEQRARDRIYAWEHQVEVDNSQVVRVWADTAVVTAKLWLKAPKPRAAPLTSSCGSAIRIYVRQPAGVMFLVRPGRRSRNNMMDVHLTMRCSEPSPAPMRSFGVLSSFSLQPRALLGAVADLVSR
jgi:ketosteroid isomerase-like protein